MEIVADRHDSGAKMITSRLPVEKWCDLTANPTRADAILDRIVHPAGGGYPAFVSQLGAGGSIVPGANCSSFANTSLSAFCTVVCAEISLSA